MINNAMIFMVILWALLASGCPGSSANGDRPKHITEQEPTFSPPTQQHVQQTELTQAQEHGEWLGSGQRIGMYIQRHAQLDTIPIGEHVLEPYDREDTSSWPVLMTVTVRGVAPDDLIDAHAVYEMTNDRPRTPRPGEIWAPPGIENTALLTALELDCGGLPEFSPEQGTNFDNYRHHEMVRDRYVFVVPDDAGADCIVRLRVAAFRYGNRSLNNDRIQVGIGPGDEQVGRLIVEHRG